MKQMMYFYEIRNTKTQENGRGIAKNFTEICKSKGWKPQQMHLESRSRSRLLRAAFVAPSTSVPAASFHYTILSAICQEKNSKKKNKKIFPKGIDKSISVCYNTDTNKGKR